MCGRDGASSAMPPSAPLRIHSRLTIAVATVSLLALMPVIAIMWLTEYLPDAARWPLVLLVLVLVAVGWIIAVRRMVRELVERPLADIVLATEAVASGEVARRIDEGATYEFAKLAAGINQMTDQLLASHQQRLRVEKLATMGRLAAGVSHEIGNPAAAIANYAHVLRMRTTHVPGTQEPIDALEREIARIDRITRSLLDYARPRRMTPRPVVVDTMIGDVLRLLSDQGVLKRVRVRTELYAPNALVFAEQHDLEQVFVNLLLNAVDAMPPDGLVVLRTQINTADGFGETSEKRRTDSDRERFPNRPSRRALAWLGRRDAPERFLQIVVADSGGGVTAGDEERIFEPFFSTKQPGKGTGLGLAIVASTIDTLGGTIWVQRAREGGAAFVILLPLHATGFTPIGSGPPA